MTRVLIHKCYDIRKKKANIVSFEEYVEPVIYDDCNRELREALASLDEKYRIVLTLFYSEGYHIDEIAKILKIPPSTIRTRWRTLSRRDEHRKYWWRRG